MRVSADLPRLDAHAVERLLSAGVAAVGVLPRGDPAAEERLRLAGVGYLVPDDAEAAVVASVLVEAVRAHSPGAPPRAAGREFADPAAALPIPPGTGDAVSEPAEPARGKVVAVWGPTGAPGRTTVAVTLAAEIAGLGRQSLLVDADVYGGTIAPMVGLLDESPGIAAACRRAVGARLDAAGLAALCWQLTPGLRVLTGIPLPARWTELRPSAFGPVLAAARRLADITVVDCGFCLETDEELSFDTVAPRRNGATLAVLDEADVVLVVGAADPIGMQRLVRGLAELREVEVGTPIEVVLNRVRDGVVPGDTERELTAALERFAGCTPLALLPADARSLDAALAGGRLLSESSPNSPLRQAIGELARTLAGVEAARPRRRHAVRSRGGAAAGR
jgi:MinD-like ATPase involved in chromosome partitioning or flagellar assembly